MQDGRAQEEHGGEDAVDEDGPVELRLPVGLEDPRDRGEGEGVEEEAEGHGGDAPWQKVGGGGWRRGGVRASSGGVGVGHNLGVNARLLIAMISLCILGG